MREGSSAVNESMLTGESRPADKEPGDEVIGGTSTVMVALNAQLLRRTDLG